jgi:molybdopterin-containing oxidoreductase family membrane subunit
MDTLSIKTYIKPMLGKSTNTKLLTSVLAVGAVIWLYYCIRILILGLSTFGINTYGATWGILVVNTIHIIGISHVGIAISASVRILKLNQYRNIARIAEFVTLIALIMAVINLLLHVGRPERFIIDVFLYGKWHSPMIWSMTVFILYFLTSFVYLYLSIRRDLWTMLSVAPKYKNLYRFLALGYQNTPNEYKRHDKVLFWLALCLIPIMISVHSVYGLLFGMISAKVGWYNPLQAPYFVLGAIVSGFSAIIAIAAILRRLYDWKSLLPDRIFQVFSIVLAFVVFLYLYFMLSEHITAQYLPKTGERAVSDALLTGRFSVLFWITTIVGLVLPLGYVVVKTLRKTEINIGMLAGAAILINVALWLKRYLLVVPTQYEPHLLTARPLIEYIPTHTEWIVVLGSYIAATLVFMWLMRLLPIIEFPVDSNIDTDSLPTVKSPSRRIVTWLSLFLGLAMIFWGVVARESDYAPVKWLMGIIFLLIIPLSNCLITDRKLVQSDDEATLQLNNRKGAGENNE